MFQFFTIHHTKDQGALDYPYVFYFIYCKEATFVYLYYMYAIWTMLSVWIAVAAYKNNLIHFKIRSGL